MRSCSLLCNFDIDELGGQNFFWGDEYYFGVLSMTGDCFEEEKTLFSATVGIKLFPSDL